MKKILQPLLIVSLILLLLTQKCQGATHDKSRRQKRLRAAQPRVIGGSDAAAGQYPFFAYWDLQGCGATLIAEDMLLSAAHCYIPDDADDDDDADDSTFGKVYLNSVNYGEGSVYDVVDVVVHPQFNGDYYVEPKYDFLLLQVNESIPAKVATPVTLNDDPTIPSLQHPWLTVLGFGSLDEKGKDYPDTLQQVDIPYIASFPTCQDLWPDTTILDAELCTLHPSPEGGLDSCYGDSGGPLLLSSSSSKQDNNNTYMVQVGIVSWGEGCGNVDAPAVAARLSYVTTDWIQPHICLHHAKKAAAAADAGINNNAPPLYCQGMTVDLPLSLRVLFPESTAAMNISWGLYQMNPPTTIYEIAYEEGAASPNIIANSLFMSPAASATTATSRKKEEEPLEEAALNNNGATLQFDNLSPGMYYFRMRQEQQVTPETDATLGRVQLIQGNMAGSSLEHTLVDLDARWFDGFYDQYFKLQSTVNLTDVQPPISNNNPDGQLSSQTLAVAERDDTQVLTVDVFYDDTPTETAWEVRNVVTEEVIAFTGGGTVTAPGFATYSYKIPVASLGGDQRQYQFRIWDEAGDGMAGGGLDRDTSSGWVEIWLGYRQVWQFDGIFEFEYSQLLTM